MPPWLMVTAAGVTQKRVMPKADAIVPTVSGREAHAAESYLCEVISELPRWANGLPVVAEGWTNERFTK